MVVFRYVTLKVLVFTFLVPELKIREVSDVYTTDGGGGGGEGET